MSLAVPMFKKKLRDKGPCSVYSLTYLVRLSIIDLLFRYVMSLLPLSISIQDLLLMSPLKPLLRVLTKGPKVLAGDLMVRFIMSLVVKAFRLLFLVLATG